MVLFGKSNYSSPQKYPIVPQHPCNIKYQISSCCLSRIIIIIALPAFCLFSLKKKSSLVFAHTACPSQVGKMLSSSVTQDIGWSEKNCQPRIPYLQKISFTNFFNHQGREKGGEWLSWNHPHIPSESLVRFLEQKSSPP